MVCGAPGELAVLLKTTAVRVSFSRAEELQLPVRTASFAPIDTRVHFGVCADLCLMHREGGREAARPSPANPT